MPVVPFAPRAKPPQNAHGMKPQAAADSVFDADGFFTQSDDEFLRDIGFSLRDLDLDQDARLAA